MKHYLAKIKKIYFLYDIRKSIFKITAVLLTTLIIYSGVAITISRQFTLEAITKEKEKNLNYVNKITRNIDFEIRDFAYKLFTDVNIRRLLYNSNYTEFERVQSIKQLESYRLLNDKVDSLILVNHTSREVFTSPSIYLEEGQAKFKKYLAALVDRRPTKPVISEKIMDLPNNTEIKFTYCISDNYFPAEATIVVNVDMEWLVETLDDLTRQDETLIVTDEFNNVIFDVNNIYSFREDLSDISTSELTDQVTSRITNLDGIKVFVSQCTVPEMGINIISISDYNSAFVHVRSMKILLIVFASIIILIGMSLSIWVAASIHRPLQGLYSKVKMLFKSEIQINNIDMLYELIQDKHNNSYSNELKKKEITTFLHRSYFKSVLLYGLETQENSTDIIDIIKNRFNETNSYLVIIFKVDHYRENLQSKSEIIYSFRECIISDIGKMLGGAVLLEAIDIKDNEIVILTGFKESSIPVKIDEIVIGAKEILQKTYEEYSMITSVYISDTINNINNIYLAYGKLNELFKYRILFDIECVLTSQFILSKTTYSCDIDERKVLLQNLHEGNTDKIIDAYEMFIDKLAYLNTDSFYFDITQLLLMTLNEINHVQFPYTCLIKIEVSDIYAKLGSCVILSDIKNIFLEIFNNLENKKTTPICNKHLLMISSVKDYIELNYVNSNISSREIADQFNISLGYLSKIFKEYNNYSIVEYIHELRLNKASKLLKEPKYTIKDIMIMVGYENESTFYKLFKKQFLITPSEYRNKFLDEKDFESEYKFN